MFFSIIILHVLVMLNAYMNYRISKDNLLLSRKVRSLELKNEFHSDILLLLEEKQIITNDEMGELLKKHLLNIYQKKKGEK